MTVKLFFLFIFSSLKFCDKSTKEKEERLPFRFFFLIFFTFSHKKQLDDNEFAVVAFYSDMPIENFQNMSILGAFQIVALQPFRHCEWG